MATIFSKDSTKFWAKGGVLSYKVSGEDLRLLLKLLLKKKIYSIEISSTYHGYLVDCGGKSWLSHQIQGSVQSKWIFFPKSNFYGKLCVKDK